MMTFITEHGKGIVLCLLIALPSWLLGNMIPVVGGPVFGILLGMISSGVVKDIPGIKKGISFVSKKILQYAVILLGFGMNLADIIMRGRQSLPIIIGTISVSLAAAYILCRLMNIPAKTATLIGVGSSICGGSAIAATAPVIDANDEEVAQAMSVIFLFNVIAALIFPVLGDILRLSNEGFGFFAGSAINDTSSVTAAAAAWDGIHGSNTLEIATIVKLTRTLAIIPITLALSFYQSKNSGSSKNGKNQRLKAFPGFILFFLLAACITTIFNLPAEITHLLKQMSKFFIIMAMGGIGLNTNLRTLLKTGGKPIVLGAICWICIISVSLLSNYLVGIW